MNAQRAKVTVRGAVQGVGFRPHVFRLATELQLDGWVLNSSQGVFIEVEGAPKGLQQFLLRLEKEKPPHAVIQSLEFSFLDTIGYETFEIRESDECGPKIALILPDIATCADCLHEIFDPDNRRYRYPFTNCTNCGPRFRIIEALPYDRPNTTMRRFAMCAGVPARIPRPAQPPLSRAAECVSALRPATGACGMPSEQFLSRQDDALRQAAELVRAGEIFALKDSAVSSSSRMRATIRPPSRSYAIGKHARKSRSR